MWRSSLAFREMKLIAFMLVIFMPGLAHAETVEGTARVVDGDTIEIKDQKIRLWGIDAPELAQRCTEDGAVYPCGLDAAHALAKQIGRKRVTCVRLDTDRYGPMGHTPGTPISRAFAMNDLRTGRRG